MSKLVKCKACGNEVAKGVKRCPNCGKDSRCFVSRHKVLTVIGGLVIIAALGSITGGNSNNKISLFHLISLLLCILFAFSK